MALDNSNDAYEELYDSSASENTDKYYDGYVEMKGTLFKWSRYYCVLKKKHLHFFKDVNTQIKDNYVGYFALEVPTHLEKKGSKEWIMKNTTRKITLRTQSEDNRNCWTNAFQKSMNGEPPGTESYILPGSGAVSPPTSPIKRQWTQSSTHQSPGQFQTPSPGPSPSRKESVRYTMSEEQVASLNKHAQSIAENIAENVAMTSDEIKIQEQLLGNDESWYQASFRREDVARILKNEKSGVFIVRDYIDVSTSRNLGFVISVKDEGGEIRHHKIQKTADGLVIKGYEGRLFDTLHNLLRFYIASQRKRIILIPYVYRPPHETREAPELPPSDYLNMTKPVSPPPVIPNKSRSASVRECHVSPASEFSRKARSRSFNDRGLPPIPPAPTQGMDRADPFSPNGPKGYEEMHPPCSDRLDGTNKEISYEIMDSPTKNGRRLPPIPSEIETPLSPPMSPRDNSSYVNVPPPPSCNSSYENFEPNSYINTPAGFGRIPEEDAPALPPKRRSASVREVVSPYINLPGRQDGPPRPPLRKAHTIER